MNANEKQPDEQELASSLLELERVVKLLRRECPWDREQDILDIVTYTLEETYELIDAAHQGHGGDVAGELGDLLYHVFFLALLAEENDWGNLLSITSAITSKLVRRHPHVFEGARAETPAEVIEHWEAVKRREGRKGIFHDVPGSLPSPLFAQRLQARAAAIGFDWDRPEPIFEKLSEETHELKEALLREEPRTPGTDKKRGPETGAYHEIGDMLFAVVNLARKLKVDPELALRSASERFRQRVERASELAAAAGEDFAGLPLDRQEEYYQQAKNGFK